MQTRWQFSPTLIVNRITQILSFFGSCSGLKVNLHKTEIFPIRCDEATISEALTDFPGKISKFPGKYLGLPLHTRSLRRVDVQPLIKLEVASQAGRANSLL